MSEQDSPPKPKDSSSAVREEPPGGARTIDVRHPVGQAEPAESRTCHLRDRVAYYEKVWMSPGRHDLPEESTEESSFSSSLDVDMFEQKLREERDRRHRSLDQVSRIEFVKLRSTPSPTPRNPADETDHSVTLTPRVVFKAVKQLHGSTEARDSDANESARFIRYEKMETRKTVQEITTTTTTSVSGGRIKSIVHITKEPLQEEIGYHQGFGGSRTPRSRSGTPSGSRYDRGSAEREILEMSRHPVIYSSGSHTSVTITNERDTIPGGIHVSIGDERTHTRSSTPAMQSSFFEDSGYEDPISAEWYNEYRMQSFPNTAVARQFTRSNSQYDSHIRQIRGM